MPEVIISILVFLIFIFGASTFSFLGVVIYRVPLKMSFVKGRSFCPACRSELNALDLIPVFSYIFLSGKCRYCKKHIPIKHLLAEILGGTLCVLCFLFYNVLTDLSHTAAVKAIVLFAFLSVLYIITVVDIKIQEIPNGFVIALAIISLISLIAFPEIKILDRIIGIFSSSLIILLITLIIPSSFGGGDIKLLAAAGFFCGWKLCLLALFIAVLTGGFFAIVKLLRKKVTKESHIAFGPFLCLGLILSFILGEQFIDLYFNLFK